MKGIKCIIHSLHLRASLLLSVFVLSFVCGLVHVNKASAIDYNINLVYDKDISSGNYTYYYKYGLNGSLRSTNQLGVSIRRANDDEVDPAPSDNAYLRYFCSNNSFDFHSGDIVLITVTASIDTSTDSSIGGIKGFYNSDDFSILNISENFISDTIVGRRSSGIYSPGSGYQNYPYLIEDMFYPYQSRSYDVLLKANRTSNYPVCLGRSGGGSDGNFYVIPPAYTVGGFTFKFMATYYMRVYHLDTSSQDMNDKDEEDRENIENQQDDSQDSSDDSQEEAESTGTTLLAAFSSFVTAITNASPSNCNLLMNMGNLNLGNVNLCTLSPPPAFQAIASVFLILFCVPLSIATARKVIDLFRSFQT